MWVSFDDMDGGLIICGDERFFVAEDATGKRFVVSARCSHRGGPLHMGKRDDGRNCIRCPWHNLATPMKALQRRSIASARIGSKWTARLPVDASPDNVVVMPLPQSVAWS